jgi:GH25 family lysozyme M1 (1,4-beta-N-acetylmuramidase)
MAEGVDLYGLYNKVTDWNAVRAAGIEFAWVKLSDGNTNREDYGYIAGGSRVGIVMGGYHYAQPGDPIAQANRLIDRCAAYGALGLAPALDLEDPFVPGAAAIDFSVRFLNQIVARGHVPCLYANNSMLSGVLGPVSAAVPGLKVWGARYGAGLTVPVDVHQYTSTGRVPGISGDVDRNRGSVLLNRPIDTDEDDYMIVKAAPDDYVSIPCNGKTLLFVATAFGRRVKILNVAAVRDNTGTGEGAYTSVGPLEEVNPDQPGPIAIGPGCRVIQLRYSADHDFTVWCA